MRLPSTGSRVPRRVPCKAESLSPSCGARAAAALMSRMVNLLEDPPYPAFSTKVRCAITTRAAGGRFPSQRTFASITPLASWPLPPNHTATNGRQGKCPMQPRLGNCRLPTSSGHPKNPRRIARQCLKQDGRRNPAKDVCGTYRQLSHARFASTSSRAGTAWRTDHFLLLQLGP